MTNPPSPQGVPIAAAINNGLYDEEAEPTPEGPTVGASDAEADAINSGATPDTAGGTVTRDSDGVPVGESDLEADRRNSGA